MARPVGELDLLEGAETNGVDDDGAGLLGILEEGVGGELLRGHLDLTGAAPLLRLAEQRDDDERASRPVSLTQRLDRRGLG